MGRAIEVERLGKRYRLGEYQTTGSLRDAATAVLRRLGSGRRPHDEIWSLRDVSFTVEEGHALGVIGRNGAGKSTLLKILSRITEPTEGVSRTRGRLAALLEVGTGFHAELTGRENVFLNGAILGMSRREMIRRFDDIVSFAGVERFIDTPVKRYSSGMYLRLAFSVAAHLEPDVLVVDEVLAVGDAEFQAKCLGRMQIAEREGRTVVFVSHNLDAIAQLCSQAIWLERGRIAAEGSTGSVIDSYVTTALSTDGAGTPMQDDGSVSLRRVQTCDTEGRPAPVLRRDRPFSIDVTFALEQKVPGLDLAVYVVNAAGVRVFDEAWSDTQRLRPDRAGTYTVRLAVPPVLNAGEYQIGVWAGSAYETLLLQPVASAFRLEGSLKGRPKRAVELLLDWELIGEEQAEGPADVQAVERQ